MDAAVLIAAARGRNTGALLAAARAASLVTTDRVVHECRRRIVLGLKRPELLDVVEALVAEMTVVPVAAVATMQDSAADVLRDAVASRNGAIGDAHVLALAWATAADIWSTDRDFAGTGVAAWSTPNLMRGLAEAAADA